MIKHTQLQQVLTEYVAATDYPKPVPKIGQLNDTELKQFNRFFTNVSDELGDEIFYVGCERREHTFTNKKGWIQYHLFIKQEI